MILKSSAHTGDRLAAHLVSSENERVRVLTGRGLVDDDLAAAITQFQAETTGTRARAGMIHVSISPDPRHPMSESGWETVWRLYEQEFGLGERARAGAEHEKEGRTHRHHVYQRIDPETGLATHLSQSYARQEYVARLAEYELGHAPTRGRHHRAVLARLERERPEVARWLEQHLEREAPTPEAVANHVEHQQQQRTGIDHARVAELAVGAWRAADSAPALEAALAEHSLVLAQGEKTPQIVDPAGGTHDLRRALRAGGERVRARDVRERIDSTALPSVEAVRAAQRERGAEQSASMQAGAEQTAPVIADAVSITPERLTTDQAAQPPIPPESPDEHHTNPPCGAQRDGATELGATELGGRRLRELRERDLAAARPDRGRAADRPTADADVLPGDARADRPAAAPVQRLDAERAQRLTAALDQERERLAEIERQLPQLRETVRSRHPDRRLAANSAWTEAREDVGMAESALERVQARRRRDQARAERWGILSPAWWRRGRNERVIAAATAELAEARSEQAAVRRAVWRRARPAYDQARHEHRSARRERELRRERLRDLEREAREHGLDTRSQRAPEREPAPQRQRVRERGMGYEPQGP